MIKAFALPMNLRRATFCIDGGGIETVFNLMHGLYSEDVTVEVIDKTYPGIVWAPTVRPIDDISVELVFNSAPPNPLTVKVTG